MGGPAFRPAYGSPQRHRRRRLAGGLSVSAVLWLLAGGGLPTISLASAAGVALLSAVAGISGAVVGEAIHRMAYRSGDFAHAR